MNNDINCGNYMQADCNHQNPSGGVSHYELEYYSASPEDSKESLSFLLERVNPKI